MYEKLSDRDLKTRLDNCLKIESKSYENIANCEENRVSGDWKKRKMEREGSGTAQYGQWLLRRLAGD